MRVIPWLCAAALLLGVGALISPSEAGDEAAAKSADGVAVVVEVWRVSDDAVARKIEVVTDKDPTDAAAVRVVMATSESAKRVSRFVTPTQFGKEMKHSDLAEKAVVAPASRRAGGGRPGIGFGGFSSEGTSITILATSLENARIGVDLTVKSTGQGKPRKVESGALIPPDKFTAEVKGSIAGASGTTRMFISQTTGADMVIVFVKASGL